MALSRPALDKVKYTLSFLNYCTSLLVQKSVDSWVLFILVKEMSFFWTSDDRLKVVEQMLGTLMVGLQDVTLIMNIYIS